MTIKEYEQLKASGMLYEFYPEATGNYNLDWMLDASSPPRFDEVESPEPYISIDTSPFTQNADARKTFPVYSGFVKYFPDAMAKIAHISWLGNEQHHPGTPLHWDREKSMDESDALMRHLVDYTKSGDIDELAKVAWRAMAWLQKEVEHDGMED